MCYKKKQKLMDKFKGNLLIDNKSRVRAYKSRKMIEMQVLKTQLCAAISIIMKRQFTKPTPIHYKS